MPRTVDLEVHSPTKGLQYAAPGAFIDPAESTYMQNVRLKQGIVQPSPGYDNFGSLNTVLGTPLLIKQYVENDGDTHLLCYTTKYIYEYNTTLGNWGNIVSRQKVLDEGDAAWTVSANITGSNDATIKVNGTSSAKFVVAAAFTTGLAGYIDYAAVNSTTCSHIHFWIRCSTTTTLGQLQVVVDNTAACASVLQTYDVPALAADTWTQVEVAIASGSNAALISVGLNIASDMGAGNPAIYLDRIIMVDRFTGDEDDRWSVDTYLDKEYATNGVDPIQVKDHSSAFDDWAEAVTATYKCRVLRTFRNHLTMGYMIEAGVEYPQRFRWTDSGGVVFTGTAGSTETEGIDEIFNLVPLGNKMAIYKANSIVLTTFIGGSLVYRFDASITATGLLAKDLVIAVGELHIFVASDNIYYYGGGSDPVPIGNSIRNEFFRVLSDQYITRAFTHYSAENEEVYFFVPSDGASSANYIWTYHQKENTWSLRKKLGMSAVGDFNTVSALTFGDAVGTFADQTLTFGDRSFSSAAPIILIGTTDRLIEQIDETLLDDLSTAIDKIYDTYDYTAASLPVQGDEPVRFTDNTKRWMRFAFEARGTTVDIYYSKNEGSTFTLLKSVTLSNVFKRYFVSLDVPSDRIRFRFRNNVSAGGFYLRWYSVSAIGRSEV